MTNKRKVFFLALEAASPDLLASTRGPRAFADRQHAETEAQHAKAGEAKEAADDRSKEAAA